jgi:hypothetical protein
MTRYTPPAPTRSDVFAVKAILQTPRAGRALSIALEVLLPALDTGHGGQTALFRRSHGHCIDIARELNDLVNLDQKTWFESFIQLELMT